MEVVRASSSLPYVCPISYVNGVPMLDGGIADSIPLEYARDKGYTNSLVVLTRNRGYRKEISSSTFFPKLFYRKYPHLAESIIARNSKYNAVLSKIEEMEDKGEITVLRPIKPVQVGRMEKNISKLEDLYTEGYDLASKIMIK